MFYLSEVLKLIKNNFISTAVFCLLTVALVVLSSNVSTFEARIGAALPHVENTHYFNALIDKKINISSIRRKIQDLPGVKRTEIISDKKRKAQLGSIQAEMGLSHEEVKQLARTQTLKIVLRKEVSQNSIKLIREYMARLSGQGNIVLGSVKQRVANEVGFKALIAKVKTWPIQFILAVMGLIWLVNAFVVRRHIQRQAYIVESFQRRENVAFKTFLTLIIFSISFGSVLSALINTPNVYVLALTSLTMTLFTVSLLGKKNWISAW